MSDSPSDITTLGAAALKSLFDGLTGAKDFVLAQAPEVLQQIVIWAIVKGVLGILAIVALSATCAWFVWYLKRSRCSLQIACQPAMVECHFWGTVRVQVAVVLGFIVVAIVGYYMFDRFIMHGLQAYFAPKYYLLERLAEMVKK